MISYGLAMDDPDDPLWPVRCLSDKIADLLEYFLSRLPKFSFTLDYKRIKIYVVSLMHRQYLVTFALFSLVLGAYKAFFAASTQYNLAAGVVLLKSIAKQLFGKA